MTIRAHAVTSSHVTDDKDSGAHSYIRPLSKVSERAGDDIGGTGSPRSLLAPFL